MARRDEIVKERLKKLEELKKNGINPYPYVYEKKGSAFLQDKYKGLGNDSKTDDIVAVAGRVMSVREMGKLVFATLQDGSGKIQVILREDTPKEKRDFFKRYVDSGDFIGVAGAIARTKRGELSVIAKDITLLSKSLLPLPEKWHGLQDKEERYRKRYLDLIMNPEVKRVFETRARIIDILRYFLKERGFSEVETPSLQSIYGGASATPFITHLNALNIDLFLSISPELYLKRLIVGGFERVFTICKNYRNEGIDRQHNPEFTMMEYYASYKNYEYHIEFTEELFFRMQKELNLKDAIEYQGKSINIKPPFQKINFRDIVLRETGIDIDKVDTYEKLKNEIENNKIRGVDIKACNHYGALLDELYKRKVRPAIIQPTFLMHYPAEMIALAKRNKEDPRKINTVQLLIDGAEIVKAYDELNDPLDQEQRLREQQQLLAKGDAGAMPMDKDFIEALKVGMPPTAGYGLGIDRLTMILTNSSSIRDVILFPFMKPEENS